MPCVERNIRCQARPPIAPEPASSMGRIIELVVGDKVYTLETSDSSALDKLDKLAGAKAKVTGTVDGTTVTVKSVAAGS